MSFGLFFLEMVKSLILFTSVVIIIKSFVTFTANELVDLFLSFDEKALANV